MGEFINKAMWPRRQETAFSFHPKAQKKESICTDPGTLPELVCLTSDFISNLAPDCHRITQGVDLSDTKIVGSKAKQTNKQKTQHSKVKRFKETVAE